MKILAIDTATEQCSVAIAIDGVIHAKVTPTARNHADLILPMVDDLLSAHKLVMQELDAIAFGRGPGSFTGVRIAAGVAQGLALATGLPVVAISDLAAVAQRASRERGLTVGATVLVCMDARMQEVYWGFYRVTANGNVELIGEEHVNAPTDVLDQRVEVSFGAGTGWASYPVLRARFPSLVVTDDLLPRAEEIVKLALVSFASGTVTNAAGAQPVYLRNDVVRPPAG